MALFVRRTSPTTTYRVPGPLWPVHALIRTPGGRELFQANVADRLLDPEDNLGLPQEPAGQVSGDATSQTAGASTDQDTNASPQFLATLAGAALFALGLWLAVRAFGTDEGPTYKAAEGIGAFALFYIAAQAAERLVELVLPSFEWVPGFGTAKKKVIVDQKIAAAYDPAVTGNGTKTPEQEAADAQADVDQARANRAVVVFGLTAALGMWACGYLEADFLTAVGVTLSIPAGSTFPDTTQQVFAMAVTGLIVGGGSKGLHDLITNISKSKTNNDTPPETGGAP